jgi:hypothetical protein
VPSLVITAVEEGLAELLATEDTIEDLVEVASDEDTLMEEDTRIEDDLVDVPIEAAEDLTEDAMIEEDLMAEEDGAAALEDTEQPDWHPVPQ